MNIFIFLVIYVVLAVAPALILIELLKRQGYFDEP